MSGGNPLLNMMGGNNPMQAMMQNNPIFGLINMFRSGGDVGPVVQQLKNQNPEFGSALDSISGKNQNEVNSFIAQKAKERGVNLSQIANQIGMPEEVQARFGIK